MKVVKTTQTIPEVVTMRLPLYLRALNQFDSEGIAVVSSQEMGSRLQFTPAQIRKDLSYFGRFGKQGRGYDVKYLLAKLKDILGLDCHWKMALVGVGQLGRAILSYRGFTPEGFEITAAFDSDPAKLGRKYGKVSVQSVSDMAKTVAEQDITIGIVAVPPADAQAVIDHMISCGLKAILNYAPITARVPKNIWVRDVDPTLPLQTMTYHLRLESQKAQRPGGLSHTSRAA